MTEFDLEFELSDFGILDQFALLSCQSYNLGNSGDWFGSFRGGLFGFYSRIYGLKTHYQILHAWLPTIRIASESEYHIASIFFNMDSALECLVFAVNALGFAKTPQYFRNITSEKGLKKISPSDIMGEPCASTPYMPISGYKYFFPKFQSHLQDNRKLISVIRDQHDVSKHREIIFSGGMSRMDPPLGFFEAIGVPDDPEERSKYWPMAEILLRNDPKSPRVGRKPQEIFESILLESVANDFSIVINKCGGYLVQDAMANIKLTHNEFITDS